MISEPDDTAVLSTPIGGDYVRVGGRFNRETIDSVLDLSEKLAEQSFLSRYKGGDVKEPRLDADRAHIHPHDQPARR